MALCHQDFLHFKLWQNLPTYQQTGCLFFIEPHRSEFTGPGISCFCLCVSQCAQSAQPVWTSQSSSAWLRSFVFFCFLSHTPHGLNSLNVQRVSQRWFIVLFLINAECNHFSSDRWMHTRAYPIMAVGLKRLPGGQADTENMVLINKHVSCSSACETSPSLPFMGYHSWFHSLILLQGALWTQALKSSIYQHVSCRSCGFPSLVFSRVR